MLKYDSFLNHIYTTETSFQTLEKFDTTIPDFIKGDLEIVKYVIDNNKLYYNCFQNCTPYAKDFTKYFNGIVEKNEFKNTIFYLFSHEGLDPYEVRNITSSETLNLIEKVPAFTFNRDTSKRFEKDKFLLPDPYLIGPDNLAIADSWGEVVDMITIKSQNTNFEDKISKVFWRGAPHAPTTDSFQGNIYNYKALDYLKQDPSIENLKHYPRMDLVKLSKAYPEIIDAYLTYSMINKRKQILNSYSEAGYDPFDFYHLGMSPNFHLNYKYLISLDGTNAAWGRVEWIMFSNSLLIKDRSTKEQWFYPGFKDKENCVMVDPLKLESLIEIIEWCEANQDEVLSIIENANEFANNYLKPENIDEYTVEAVNKYTELIGENYYNSIKEKAFGDLIPAASLNEKAELILENKPTNIFKILDLPIMSSFLTKHVDTVNKILFKKEIALYNQIHIDMDKAKDLFGNSKIDEAFIKNFFEDRSIIKSLIGVDLINFFYQLRIKNEKNQEFLDEIDKMIEDALKIKKYIEKVAIAGSNIGNQDKKIEKNSQKEDL